MDLQPFSGVVTNLNQHYLPPGGAQVQTNITCQTPYQLDVRKGFRPVTFANAAAAIASDVIAMTAFERPEARWVVYLLSNGALKAGRNAS